MASCPTVCHGKGCHLVCSWAQNQTPAGRDSLTWRHFSPKASGHSRWTQSSQARSQTVRCTWMSNGITTITLPPAPTRPLLFHLQIPSVKPMRSQHYFYVWFCTKDINIRAELQISLWIRAHGLHSENTRFVWYDQCNGVLPAEGERHHAAALSQTLLKVETTSKKAGLVIGNEWQWSVWQFNSTLILETW